MLSLKFWVVSLLLMLPTAVWYYALRGPAQRRTTWDPSPTDYINGKHTCRHCERILIRFPPHWQSQDYNVLLRLDLTVADVHRAAADGCPLLILYFSRGEGRVHYFNTLQEIMNIFVAIFVDKQIHYYTSLTSRYDRLVYFLHAVSNRPFYLRLARFESGSEGVQGVLFAQLVYLNWCSNEIDVSANESSVAARFINERPANRDVASDHSFWHARRWLADCLSRQGKHLNCGIATTNDFVPTWLIEVQTRGDGSVHGRICQPKPGDAIQWCCLSYCWGGDQRIKLLKANVQNLSERLPSDLPHTIRDAMIVTNRVGLHYLWVDALCIIQDDPDQLSLEITRLPQIYQYALFTICASSAATHLDGFLGRRRHDIAIPKHVFLIPSISIRCEFPTQDVYGSGTVISESPSTAGIVTLSTREPYYQFTNEPINKRAWTFQERLLSRRVLDYCSDKLRCICGGAGNAPDGGSALVNYQWTMLPDAAALATLPNIERDRLWHLVVVKYTDRSMTFASDRLLAIAAVAAEFARAFGDSGSNSTCSSGGGYAAGLWRSAMVQQLAWFVGHSFRRERPATYTGPSWSWAGIQGPVAGWLSLQEDEPAVAVAEVVDCSVDLVHKYAPFGAVKGARLVLRGPMREISWLYNRSEVVMPGRRPEEPMMRFIDNRMRLEAIEEEAETHFFGFSYMDALESNWSSDIDAEIKAWCLQLVGPTSRSGSRCIILARDVHRPEEAAYKRVGYVMLGDSSKYSNYSGGGYPLGKTNFFKDTKPRMIIIV